MRWIVTLTVLIVTFARTGAAGELIVVQLRDGRTVSGELDSATTASQLWVNRSEQGIALRSGFSWSDLHAVVHNSKQHPAEEFRQLVGQLASSKPALMDDLNPVTTAVTEVADAAGGPQILPVAYTSPPPVRSLRVRAWTASWDDDPELDGLLVEVTPLGPHGEFVPVDAQLTMTLIGEHSQGHPEQLRRFRPRYPQITRGSEQVRAEHFWAGPAVYKLPYRNQIPEEHLDLFPQGVLTATLGVAGQGSFSASTDAVALIPASPIRDRRQQWFGRRYFPQENSRLQDSGRFGGDRKTNFISLSTP